MPVTYFNKQCPGADVFGCCVWSTECLGDQALIVEKSVLCPICLVVQGLHCDVSHLQLQLANLYLLDIDQFQKARNAIGDVIFEKVRAPVLHILTSGISSSNLLRGKQCKSRLERSFRLLDRGSWILRCWGNRVAQDTRDICHYEAAIGKFAMSIKGLIYEFLCADAWKLCAHLCVVKRRGYHVFEQPLFWVPWCDVSGVSIDNHYDRFVSIITDTHKPKLQYLKMILLKHDYLITRNCAMYRHGRFVKMAIGLVDSMLNYESDLIYVSLFKSALVA